VYCPDCGLQWVADEGVHTRGCRHLDLAKRPTQMDDEELLLLALWLADGGERRMVPSEPDWSAEDYSAVRGVLGRLRRRLPEPVRRPRPARQGGGVTACAPPSC
jgi:hypothetical protein